MSQKCKLVLDSNFRAVAVYEGNGKMFLRKLLEDGDLQFLSRREGGTKVFVRNRISKGVKRIAEYSDEFTHDEIIDDMAYEKGFDLKILDMIYPGFYFLIGNLTKYGH